MQINTKWFGTVEIDAAKVITFEKGLIGFEDCSRFAIVYETEDKKEKPIMWLQSLDEQALALPIIKPEYIVDEYAPDVEDELVYKLGENVKITLAEHLRLTWNSREQIFRMEFQDNLLGSGRTMRGREITRLTDMRVIVDASCVEVFLNGGKDVFSTRFYPEGEEIGVTVNAPGAAGRLRA